MSQQGVVCVYFMLCFINKEVCYQYWSSSGSQRFGKFTVEILDEEALQGFVLRTLNVQHAKVSQTAYALKYTITEYYCFCSLAMLVR